MKDRLRVDIIIRDKLAGKMFRLHDEEMVAAIQKMMKWREEKYGDREEECQIQ